MTLATRSSSSIATPFNLSQFAAALQSAIVSAGFPSSPYDTFNSPDNLTTNIVNQFVFDSTKIYGQVFHEISITSDSNSNIVINQQLHTSWDKVNHAGSHSGRQILGVPKDTYGDSVSLIGGSSGYSIYFYSFSHPEVKAVLINQGSNWGNVSLWRPSTKLIPSVFDEKLFPFAFIPSNDLSRFYGCSNDVSPFSVSRMPNGDTNSYSADIYAIEYSEFIRYRVSATNVNKEIRHSSPKFYSTAAQGAIAQFSSDIGLIGSDSLNTLQEITVSGNTHVLLFPRGGMSGITIASSPAA